MATVAKKPVEQHVSLSVCVRKERDDFTLEVEFTAASGITILFGPSGAGKTTVLDCVSGIARPEAGSIRVGERLLFDAALNCDVPVAHRNVGYVFQRLALFPHLTVASNVEYGLSHLDRGERRARSAAILESFHIIHLRDRNPSAISGGERQRVALARALVTDPCVLLLDEPLRGLDLPTREQLLDDLRTWNTVHRIPILYVTHARDEVFALGERVIVLQEGKVRAQGAPSDTLDGAPDSGPPQGAMRANMMPATVTEMNSSQGTMTCCLRNSSGNVGPSLEVPIASSVRRGSNIRLAVRARDILLAPAAPPALSGANVLRGRVAGWEQGGSSILAELECGVRLWAELTPGTPKALELRPGCEVWLVLPVSSCHVRQ